MYICGGVGAWVGYLINSYLRNRIRVFGCYSNFVRRFLVWVESTWLSRMNELAWCALGSLNAGFYDRDGQIDLHVYVYLISCLLL